MESGTQQGTLLVSMNTPGRIYKDIGLAALITNSKP